MIIINISRIEVEYLISADIGRFKPIRSRVLADKKLIDNSN